MSVDLQIQIIAVCLFALLFVLLSLVLLRKRHVEQRRLSVCLGAFIFGSIFATFIIGVFIPLQQLVLSDPLHYFSPEGRMQMAPALIALLLLVRSDLTGRIPLVGGPIRAYLSAMLRRSIESAEKRLEKMAALDLRSAQGV